MPMQLARQNPAGGTRGASLAAGSRSLRLYDQEVAINAEGIQLAASADADADEIVACLRSAPHPPRADFVTHGESAAADELRRRIKHELGWRAHAPSLVPQ